MKFIVPKTDNSQDQYVSGRTPILTPIPTATSASASSTMIRMNNTLAHYLTGMTDLNSDNRIATDTISRNNNNSNFTLEEARKGRERIVAILEDAGIDNFDPKDVIRLPLWSSVTELYYSSSRRSRSRSTGDSTG